MCYKWMIYNIFLSITGYETTSVCVAVRTEKVSRYSFDRTSHYHYVSLLRWSGWFGQWTRLSQRVQEVLFVCEVHECRFKDFLTGYRGDGASSPQHLGWVRTGGVAFNLSKSVCITSVTGAFRVHRLPRWKSWDGTDVRLNNGPFYMKYKVKYRTALLVSPLHSSLWHREKNQYNLEARSPLVGVFLGENDTGFPVMDFFVGFVCSCWPNRKWTSPWFHRQKTNRIRWSDLE